MMFGGLGEKREYVHGQRLHIIRIGQNLTRLLQAARDCVYQHKSFWTPMANKADADIKPGETT